MVRVQAQAPPRVHIAPQAQESIGYASAIAETISMAVLEVQGTTVAVDTPLMSAGLDSIATMELANVLAERLGTELPQTVLFDHPTIGAVASYAATSSVAGSVGYLPSSEEATSHLKHLNLNDRPSRSHIARRVVSLVSSFCV